MRTSDQTRPETLLAAVNTFFTDMVILPPAVLTQEECPFQPPFLASAHMQSFRACLVACPHYSSKRSKICEDKGAKNAE